MTVSDIPAWNEELHREYRAHIDEGAPRAAFDEMVRLARRFDAFDVRPGRHGPIRDIRYYDAGSKTQPFAFIVNRQHLLFYVRRPGLTRIAGGLPALRKRFPSTQENSAGEWTVRVESVDEARRLSEFVFGTADARERWRTDPEAAAAKLDELLAVLSAGQRRHCLDLLDDVIRHASTRHSDRWMVNLHAHKLRIIVGMVQVLGLFDDGRAVVLVKKTALPPALARLKGGSYKNAPGCIEVEMSIEELLAKYPLLRSAHEAAMAACAAAHRGVPSHREAHSPGVVAYLERRRPTVAAADSSAGEALDASAALARVTRAHVLDAIARFDAGERGQFGESTRYDLEHQGRRYPPKGIVGLAARPVLGRDLTPKEFSSGGRVFELLARLGFVVVSKDDDHDDELLADLEELRLRADDTIPETQKSQLINARRGQGAFRAAVLAAEPKCRVTGVGDPDHLRASHIKPWAKSTNAERLDGNNGLMLAPHVDHLFDRGFISFTDVGDLLVSSQCSAQVLDAWGVSPNVNVGPFTALQRPYLAFHRARVLKS